MNRRTPIAFSANSGGGALAGVLKVQLRVCKRHEVAGCNAAEPPASASERMAARRRDPRSRM